MMMNEDGNVLSLNFLDFYNPIKLAPWPALTSIVIAEKSKYAQAYLASTMRFHDPRYQQGNFYELLGFIDLCPTLNHIENEIFLWNSDKFCWQFLTRLTYDLVLPVLV